GLVRNQLKEVSLLRRLQVRRSSLSHEFPGDQQAEPIALFGLFQIVRRDENCHAAISETVDHFPESAACQWIDTRGGFVEKEHAGFMHDRSAEGNALLPAARQAASHEMASSFQSREGQYPSLLLGAVFQRHAVNAGEEIEVLFNRQIVVQREFLRHISDALPYGGGAERTTFTGECALPG